MQTNRPWRTCKAAHSFFAESRFATIRPFIGRLLLFRLTVLCVSNFFICLKRFLLINYSLIISNILSTKNVLDIF